MPGNILPLFLTDSYGNCLPFLKSIFFGEGPEIGQRMRKTATRANGIAFAIMRFDREGKLPARSKRPFCCRENGFKIAHVNENIGGND